MATPNRNLEAQTSAFANGRRHALAVYGRFRQRHGPPSTSLARSASLIAVLLALVVLAGWVFDVSILKNLLPGAVEMKANDAIGLALAGGALFIYVQPQLQSWQPLAQVFAVITAALGIATLGEYTSGMNFGIDEFFFLDSENASSHFPGRFSFTAAIAFISAGLALAILPYQPLAPLARASAAVVAAIGTLSFFAFFWQISDANTHWGSPPVALHGAIGLSILGGGLWVATLVSSCDDMRLRGDFSAILAPVEMKIIAGVVSALFLLAVSGGITYRTTAEYAVSAQRFAHSQAVRAAVSHLYADISNAESAQRDYLIGGRQYNLDQYRAFTSQIERRRAAVAAMVVDHAGQSQHLIDLGLVVDRFIGLLDRGVDVYQQQGFAAARDLALNSEGFPSMEMIRSMLERVEQMEQDILSARGIALAHRRQRTLIALVLTLLLAACIVVLAFRAIRKEMVARVEAEKALLSAEEAADHANRAKRTFLAIMSHEIRTSMNGVLGMLQLLSLSKLDGEQHAKLEIMRESSESLLRIIDDVVDFSKIDAQQLEVIPETMSVQATVKSVCRLLEGCARSKHVRLSYGIDPRISPALLADPVRIRQILNSLVSNALKFTPSGGMVNIAVDLFERLATSNGDHRGSSDRIRFSVSDNGIGMTSDDQKQLFAPFSQGPSNTSRLYGGAGLGLIVCRSLAEIMGGSLELRSETGKGTVTTLILMLPIGNVQDLPQKNPCYEPDFKVLNPASAQTASASAFASADPVAKILVIDDHPINQSLLMRQVKFLGYSPESAVDGVQALEKWQQHRFDIVLTDCNMPNMDGYELARQIRGFEAGSGSERVPIIACTADAMPSNTDTCLAVGIDDFLAKPIDLANLRAKLARWLPASKRPNSFVIIAQQLEPAANQEVAVIAHDANIPLDKSVLAEVCGGIAAAERGVMDNFQKFTVRDAVLLRQAAIANDMARVAHLGHRIKGASLAIGANDLAAACTHLVSTARNNDAAASVAHMHKFDVEYARLFSYLDAHKASAADTQGRFGSQ